MKISIILLTFFAFGSLRAQLSANQVDYQLFSKEILKTDNSIEEINLTMWLPPIFWDVASSQLHLPQKDVDELKSYMKDYTILIVCRGTIDLRTGVLSMLSESELRQKLLLEYNNKTYEPLKTEELSDDQLSMSIVIKPIFSQMMGQFGSGIQIFFFSTGEISPLKNEDFSLSIGTRTLTYELPIACLYPNKTCTEDKKEYPSNYIYCPIHGNKLK